MEWAAYRPAIAVAIPFIASLLIGLSSASRSLRESWTFIASVLMWLVIGSLGIDLLNGNPVSIELFSLVPGIRLAFHADAFGLTFAIVSSTLWIATSSYSIGYMRSLNLHAQTRFFALFAICLGSTIGLALAANMLTFVLFYEILTIATYPLVVHLGSQKAKNAGRMYLCYALPAGAALLLATAWSFMVSGHVNFIEGGFLPHNLPQTHLVILFILCAFGFGVKAGLMPLHAWLPSAMVAPTPVSALLHAVAVVKAGVFGFLRLIYFIFGPELMFATRLWEAVAIVAAITILLSSLIALRQDEIKRRLAYSTIGHLSYIVLGAAMLVPSGQIGSLLHLANHAMMKITLFFCAGAIHVAAHKDYVSQLRGLGWRMPWTFSAFAIGALGLAGVPGICGFISKWWICKATLEAHSPWLMGVLLISGVLNMAYLLPIVTLGFDPTTRKDTPVKEAPKSMLIPIVFTAAASLIFGLIVPAISAQLSLAQEGAMPVGRVL